MLFIFSMRAAMTSWPLSRASALAVCIWPKQTSIVGQSTSYVEADQDCMWRQTRTVCQVHRACEGQ